MHNDEASKWPSQNVLSSGFSPRWQLRYVTENTPFTPTEAVAKTFWNDGRNYTITFCVCSRWYASSKSGGYGNLGAAISLLSISISQVGAVRSGPTRPSGPPTKSQRTLSLCRNICTNCFSAEFPVIMIFPAFPRCPEIDLGDVTWLSPGRSLPPYFNLCFCYYHYARGPLLNGARPGHV